MKAVNNKKLVVMYGYYSRLNNNEFNNKYCGFHLDKKILELYFYEYNNYKS